MNEQNKVPIIRAEITAEWLRAFEEVKAKGGYLIGFAHLGFPEGLSLNDPKVTAAIGEIRRDMDALEGMDLKPCLRCSCPYHPPKQGVNYCPDCIRHFQEIRRRIGRAQNIRLPPRADGSGGLSIHADLGPGAFDPVKDCPRSGATNHGEEACGVCGATDSLEPVYGIGSGFGCGGYNFCQSCGMVQDFSEDNGE